MGRGRKSRVSADEVSEMPEEVSVIESEDTIADGLKEAKPKKTGDWIVVTREELKIHEREGRLIGYDPETSEALLK